MNPSVQGGTVWQHLRQHIDLHPALSSLWRLSDDEELGQELQDHKPCLARFVRCAWGVGGARFCARGALISDSHAQQDVRRLLMIVWNIDSPRFSNAAVLARWAATLVSNQDSKGHKQACNSRVRVGNSVPSLVKAVAVPFSCDLRRSNNGAGHMNIPIRHMLSR
jgi:hypothetical protein